MRILVTGGTGFVGLRIVELYKTNHEVFVPTRGEMDITVEEACMQYIEDTRPDVVFHFAAISNMGTCEDDPEKSYMVNVLGAINVAKACKQVGAKMIFASTDQVYNGSKTGELGKESDNLEPLNTYAKHKLEAEYQVLNITEAVCLRLPWMCDATGDTFPAHADFYSNFCKSIDDKKEIMFSEYYYRSITNVHDIVEHLLKLVDVPSGVYNYAATGFYNTYEIAYEVAKIMGEKTATDISEYIKSNPEMTEEKGRNIAMDMSKITACGMEFDDVIISISKLICR